MSQVANGDNSPHLVEERSSELFEAARSLLGDRLAECRIDPDRGARLTVVDLTDNDISALRTAASSFGMADRTRIERADPAALDAWEKLRHDLIRLSDDRPPVLQSYPTPDPGYQRPPVNIHLQASAPAAAAAAELHDRYGDFVALSVGALPYPPNQEARGSQPRTTKPARDEVDPAEMVIELDGPLAIRSGDTVTHALLVHNTSEHPITVNTNGTLTANIIDPGSGATGGGFTGSQFAPLITFTARPGQTVAIPLLVGTASFMPDLGYAIPPGTWQLTAPLDLADRRQLVTKPMAFGITD